VVVVVATQLSVELTLVQQAQLLTLVRPQLVLALHMAVLVLVLRQPLDMMEYQVVAVLEPLQQQVVAL
jgi:hypothetical protein